MREHISLSEACKILKKNVSAACCVEKIPLGECLGRVLGSDIIAARNIPHFNASAVDGYATRSELTKDATPATPAVISGEWVNTGMPIEPCFDSVLMVEDSSRVCEHKKIFATKSLTTGENVRPIGEDVSIGQVAAREGDVISPSLAALFLALGMREVPVLRLPKTLYVPTGDEIVPSAEWLSMETPLFGKTAESNSTMIAGFFKKWGLPLDCAERISDDPQKMLSLLESVHDKYDLILIGAGSAKGEKDFTAKVLSEHGEVFFHWLLMKPARPTLAGKYKNCFVVNLPGFPMSSAVALWSVAFPLLKLLYTGDFDEESVLQEAVCACEEASLSLLLPHSSPVGKAEWLRLKAVEIDNNGFAFPLSSGSSTMWAIAEADGVALLPENVVECEKGSRINVWLTRNVDLKRRILFQGSNDPAFERIGSFVRKRGGELVTRSVGSLGGLAALARNEAHVAAAHLLDAETGKYNDSFIDRFRGNEEWLRELLFWREQGIIVKRGNPQKINGIEDFFRDDVSIINRQPGAGTRVLLDFMLKERGILPSQVKGYERVSVTHFDAANRVAAGLVSAALAVRVAAQSADLDFIPVAVEPYELVIPKKYVEHRGVVALLEATRERAWRAQVEQMGGYKCP